MQLPPQQQEQQLRKDLDEARSKLDTIANIEKSVDERRRASAAAGVSTRGAEEVTVTGARIKAPSEKYAPGTLVQAGPGVPSWSYGVHSFGWSGPVDTGQTVRFIVLGPVEVAAWRIAGAALLALFLMQLARAGLRAGMGLPALLGRGAAPVLLLMSAFFIAPAGHAQTAPSAELLRELHARLIEPPRCAPSCAELLAAQIRIDGDRMEAQLRASTLASVAVSLPSAGYRWQIDTVAVDGTSSIAMAHEGESGLWVPLQPGVHTVRLEGRLLGDSVHLAFPMTPRQVSVAAPGWVAGGINAGRLLSGTLDLTRQEPAQGNALTARGSDSQEFPPFVLVLREFKLGREWSLATTLQRISPSQAAFTVALPLLPGESVLTEGLQVNPNGTALVGLAAGADSLTFNSSLSRAEALSVHLPALPARSEVWRFTVSPQWHVLFKGLPAILPEEPDSTPWVFEYRPRPGEGLDLTITQPPPVAGATLAIDQVRQQVNIGRRSSEETLELHYRSTQGGRQVISLPSEASVTRVAVDGDAVPIRPQNGELALSVLPGEHRVEIGWRSQWGEELTALPDPIELHAPASNVQTSLSLPADRWPLFALGPGVGPAFLYWGELLVFLVVAIVLGRSKYSPLGVGEWLLLGIGLSTLSWGVLFIVAVWLFAISWRERTPLTLPRLRFYVLQVLLALLTVVAVSALVLIGVRYGLLASPDMGVMGPGSFGSTFSWFVDHTTSALPRPTLYSVPIWVYRAVMFAWALWIALALARWLRLTFRALSAQGYWKAPQSAPPGPPADAPAA
jgi:hypothetical protein